MIARHMLGRHNRRLSLLAVAILVLTGVIVRPALAAERKFFVMLAYSPKEHMNPELVNFALINSAYFDTSPNNIFSFAEWWKEVTYSDVTISGQTSGWVVIPWPYHAPDGNTPQDLIGPESDIGINTKDKAGNGLPTYAYGAGEDVIANDVMIRIDTDNRNNTPAVPGVVLANAMPLPPMTGDESYVWTPGERFLDLDMDGAYDMNYECAPVGMGPDPNCNPAMGTGTIPMDANGDGTIGVCMPPMPGEMNWPPMGCECVDTNGVNGCDFAEPYEDFMRVYNPMPDRFDMQWPMVTTAYVMNNYPGNKTGLNMRTGNSKYDSPDRWTERGNTKMIQRPGGDRFITATPEPGMYPGVSANVQGTPWFQSFWMTWYGTTPPAWPTGTQMPPCPPQCGAPVTSQPNTPNMVPFETYVPDEETTWRYFNPNKGGLKRNGVGFPGGPDANFFNWDPATLDYRNPTADGGGANIIMPDNLGFYDGWVEHDDLASSKYHRPIRGGDQRLGEVTSPFMTQFVGGDPFNAIWGKDNGPNDPNTAGIMPDGFTAAAGPFAINVHGSNGLDAGNVLLLEWLTWRTDGTSKTGAPGTAPNSFWELGFGTYHPYQGKGSMMSPSINIGFRDYNVDGIIDQGEVRPIDSENYVTDGNPSTINNGGPSTEYPWNRQRMIEDVMAALDLTVDFDAYNDANSLNVVGIPQVPGPDPFPTGLLSGVLLLPVGAQNGREWSLPAPSFYPIHNEDQAHTSFANQYNWHIYVHDIVTSLGGGGEGPADLGVGDYQTAFSAHEYMHSWEGIPDLYDYDVYGPPGLPINHPIGRWCVMAGGGLVHPVGILKEDRGWIEATNIETILVPGVPKQITLAPAEFFRLNTYLYYENAKLNQAGSFTCPASMPPSPTNPIVGCCVPAPNGSSICCELPINQCMSPAVGGQVIGFDCDATSCLKHERFYFWSSGKGFDQFTPGPGLLILHTDRDANTESLPLQQLLEGHFTYQIVQADGLGQLESNSNLGGGGNDGDAADPYPGAILYPGQGQNPNTSFAANTTPPSRWNDLSPTGLRVDNIVHDAVAGTTTLRLTWNPPDVPSLTFINPPGGQSVNSMYSVNYEATDAFGGTVMRFYRTTTVGNFTTVDSGPNSNFIAQTTKLPGTVQGTASWNLSNVPNNTYYIFAKLIPGPGVDGTDVAVSPVRIGPNNVGNGTLNITTADVNLNVSKSEAWTVRNVGNNMWQVTGTYSGVQTAMATTGQLYMSDPIDLDGPPVTNGQSAIKFTIVAGPVPFAIDDEFVFVTTGFTAHSASVQVLNSTVTNGPTAVLNASPLTGPAPLQVNFNSLGSTDPNGQPLTFTWNFGDGSPIANGPAVAHTYQLPGAYTVTLTATNLSGLFGQATSQILAINDVPHAVVTATPTNGPTPLTVNFNGSASNDPEGQALIFAWDFGDGMIAGDGTTNPIFQQVTHTYFSTPGTPTVFTAALTVTDPAGGSDSETIMITVGNSAPVVNVAVDNRFGDVPLTVTFRDNGSYDPDDEAAGAAALMFAWDVGVSGVAPLVGAEVEYTYAVPGVYTPRVTVTDELGLATSQFTQQVIASAEGTTPVEMPVASFTVDINTGVVPLTVEFDGSDSSGPAGATLTHAWEFGDGGTATGPVVTHTYVNAGSFIAKLTVSDGTNSSSMTRTITATTSSTSEPVPVARIDANPQTGAAPLTVTFSAADSTPADGSLTFSWDFGDGTAATGIEVAHTFTSATSFNVVLTATGPGGVDTATVTVNVTAPPVNRAPVAIIASGPRTGVAPVSLTFDGSLSRDPDNDPMAYLWQVSLGSEVVQTNDTGARVALTFADPGEYRVTLTVTDTLNASNTSAPETVTIRARSTGGSDGGDSGQDIPATGRRRSTGFCGLGFAGLAAMALGLAAMSAVHRKRQ